MQIEIKLDESCKEPKIIIHTDKMTEEAAVGRKTGSLCSDSREWRNRFVRTDGNNTDLCRKRTGICKDKRRQLPVKGKTV